MQTNQMFLIYIELFYAPYDIIPSSTNQNQTINAGLTYYITMVLFGNLRTRVHFDIVTTNHNNPPSLKGEMLFLETNYNSYVFVVRIISPQNTT